MSRYVDITAYSGKGSKEFQKHFNAVNFCIENNLSFPKETSEFFKGKFNGDSLEDFNKDAIIHMIENGIEVPLILNTDKHGDEIRLKVLDIPLEAEELVIRLH